MKFELKKQVIEYVDKKTNQTRKFNKYYIQGENGAVIYIRALVDTDKNGNKNYRNSILLNALASEDVPF